MHHLAPLIFALVLLSGCSTQRTNETPQGLLAHDVPIPPHYRSGDPWPGFDGGSKRYTYSYESAWWACIEDFARDIDYKPTTNDRVGNGWPAAVDGYWDGYADAETRVAILIKRFGKEQARDIFKRALNPPP